MKTNQYPLAFALTSILICLIATGSVSAQQEVAVVPVNDPEPTAQTQPTKTLVTTVTEKLPDTAAVSDTNASPTTPPAPAQPALGDGWEFEVTPYVWLPSISGNVRVGDTDVDIDSSGSDVLGSLKGAFFMQFEARKKKFALLFDESYAHLGVDGTLRGPFATPYTIEPTLNMFEAGMGYTLFSKAGKEADAPPVVSVEVTGGIRVVYLKLELLAGAATEGLPGPGISREGSRTFVDAIVGNRLKFRPHRKFTVNLNYTIGGGGSKFSWGFNALGDYRINKLFSLAGGYRILDINADRSSNPVGIHARLSGLVIALGIHF